MKGLLDKAFAEPFARFLEKVEDFLPNLFTSLIVFLVGLFAAWLLKAVTARLLKFLRVDDLAERTGITQALLKGGIRDPLSSLVGRLFYWITLVSFVIMSLGALKIPAVEQILAKFIIYLPNVIAAIVIVGLGFVVSNFLGRAALIASVNAGFGVSGLIGRLVKYAVFLISVSMALELLGIGRDTVLVAFGLAFGGVVFALSVAFGLGGKSLAKDYIERRLREQGEKDDLRHL
ncbi:MAG: hypothetical protein Kow0025_18520 [Thermodesulfovibrionales bacterium]